jgi:hypothetical protein
MVSGNLLWNKTGIVLYYTVVRVYLTRNVSMHLFNYPDEYQLNKCKKGIIM